MNKFLLLQAITLNFASSFGWAETNRADDLRYCLVLPNAQLIATCAGEISAGSKGRTYTKEQVAEILSKQQSVTPAGASDSSGIPATVSDISKQDFSPEQSEEISN